MVKTRGYLSATLQKSRSSELFVSIFICDARLSSGGTMGGIQGGENLSRQIPKIGKDFQRKKLCRIAWVYL